MYACLLVYAHIFTRLRSYSKNIYKCMHVYLHTYTRSRSATSTGVRTVKTYGGKVMLNYGGEKVGSASRRDGMMTLTRSVPCHGNVSVCEYVNVYDLICACCNVCIVRNESASRLSCSCGILHSCMHVCVCAHVCIPVLGHSSN